MRKCIVNECNGKHKGKGYCQKHLRKFNIYGDPLMGKENELHSMKHTPEYKIWLSMKHRCFNQKSTNYEYYGERGITVCDKWRNSFLAFYKDMGDSNGLTLDRVNVNGNYEPSNCRWIDKITQSRNQRIRKDNKTGVKGVQYLKNGLYKSMITVNYKKIHLGYFNTLDEAVKSRKNAEEKYFK